MTYVTRDFLEALARRGIKAMPVYLPNPVRQEELEAMQRNLEQFIRRVYDAHNKTANSTLRLVSERDLVLQRHMRGEKLTERERSTYGID